MKEAAAAAAAAPYLQLCSRARNGAGIGHASAQYYTHKHKGRDITTADYLICSASSGARANFFSEARTKDSAMATTSHIASTLALARARIMRR